MSNNCETSLDRPRFDDEGVETATSIAQSSTEEKVGESYRNKHTEFPELKRAMHIDYLVNTLRNLPLSYEVMDCSRTWIVYWTLHSLALLGHELDSNLKDSVVAFLRACQHPDGGFGGGPGQQPHLAPTYAAVNALSIIGTTDALEMIDREKMVDFLKRMRVGDGSFFMHEDGEVDMRSVYCCAVITVLLNIEEPDLFNKSVDWIARCQTYEGGFSGTPGMEAHGGYTYCGLCSLYLLNGIDRCDLRSLKRWILNRQTAFEGGFQGRTNKLVDSCYSFWQCGTLASLMFTDIEATSEWHFDSAVLQEYLLTCCQHVQGGFIDKPTTFHDPYHTCYALSGLSIAQSRPIPHSLQSHCSTGNNTSQTCAAWREATIVGNHENRIVDIHPVYNLPMNIYKRVRSYFKEVY